MLDLMGRHKPNFLFTERFLQQLPSQVWTGLANTTITDCQALAEESDGRIITMRGRDEPSSRHFIAAGGHIGHCCCSSGNTTDIAHGPEEPFSMQFLQSFLHTSRVDMFTDGQTPPGSCQRQPHLH